MKNILYICFICALSISSKCISSAEEEQNFVEGLEFNKKPSAVSLVQSITTNDGNLEVHFRNPDHLSQIMKQTPDIQAPFGRVIFVKDARVEDGNEFQTDADTIKRQKFILIEADSPLIVTGDTCSLAYNVRLPEGSDSSALQKLTSTSRASQNTVSTFTESDSKFQNSVKQLILSLQNPSQSSYQDKTADAHALFEGKKPTVYKNSPITLSSSAEKKLRMMSSGEITLTDDYYLDSETGLLLYVARDHESLSELVGSCRDFHNSISYIDPDISHSALFTQSKFALSKIFRVSCPESDLYLLGELNLPDAALEICARDLCQMGSILRAEKDIRTLCRSMYMGSLLYNPGWAQKLKFGAPRDTPAIHRTNSKEILEQILANPRLLKELTHFDLNPAPIAYSISISYRLL